MISVSGCKNLDSGCGIYACDPEGYDVFQDVLNPIIKDYHKVAEIQHPKPDFGDLNNLGFGDLDPSGELIVSTRVRVGRSHASFGFPPVVNAEVSYREWIVERFSLSCRNEVKDTMGMVNIRYPRRFGLE
jgi:hypothetical protein